MKKVFALMLSMSALSSAIPPSVSAAELSTPVTDNVINTKIIPYKKAEVMQLAERVADYQIATLAAGLLPEKASYDTPHRDGWVQGALFIGLTELADHSKQARYRQLILARGEANKWAVQSSAFADNHAIGQPYLWAAQNGAGAKAITPLRQSFDAILKNPPKADLKYLEEHERNGGSGCLMRWCWCDAIFMSPATWIGLSNATGDPRYTDYAKSEFWATTDYLYDRSENLYFRDSRFFERRNSLGKKVFWSRGNGWVFAGLARIIPLLPANDPDRARMVVIFKEMATKLKAIQKPDGYWSPSLLDAPESTRPETSGTAFYVYGMAWGIKNGILAKADYEPAVRLGWGALVKAIHPDGKLGWVQPVSDRPEEVAFEDTQYYGVGGFLLAATAVADLDLKAVTANSKQIKSRK